LTAYKNSLRTDWVQVWPGQVVLCGSSVYWTEQVEDAITRNCLQDYFDNVQVGRTCKINGHQNMIVGTFPMTSRDEKNMELSVFFILMLWLIASFSISIKYVCH
jgi:hypothetical protein